MHPLISIIIPTYNSEQYLYECFDSVINQTYENLEVIIVDGGSVDKTKTIAQSYCKKRKNWKFIIADKGVAHQRNVGLDNLKGDYLYFLDSDDYISKNLINDLYNKLIADSLDLVTPEIHNKYFLDNKLNETKIIEPKINRRVSSSNFFEEGYNSFLAGPTKLYKRELIGTLRFDETLSNGEDLLFNYKLVENKTLNYDVCKGAIYYYRHNVTLTNSAYKRMNESGYLFCNKMVDILEKMEKDNDNFFGALSILDIQLKLFMKAYLSIHKRIPKTLNRARKFMYKNITTISR